MLTIQAHDPLRDSAVFASPAATSRRPELKAIRALVMLHGVVRPTALTQAIGRSVLDLPIVAREHSLTILHSWFLHADIFAQEMQLKRFIVRLVLSRNTPAPDFIPVGDCAAIQLERDRAQFRGTAGVLSDVAQEYSDDDYLLVSSGAQVLIEPLSKVIGELLDSGGDVCLAARRDGSPTGLALVRCGCLRDVPPEGFVDFNEQLLPKLARTFDVRVAYRDRHVGMPVRTLGTYISALREFARRHHQRTRPTHPWDENWQNLFAITERGARVAQGSVVHNSVVLAGGVIEPGAVVVRSVIGPDACVRSGEQALDVALAA